MVMVMHGHTNKSMTGQNPDKFYNYSSIISLGKCDGGWNTVKDPFSRICVPNRRCNFESIQHDQRNK